MERFHLKNIIILILVLLNGFLLFSLAQRRTSEQNAYRRTVEQLVALFQRDGMDLDPGAISRASPPSGVSLVRDTALEEQAAAFLLGQAPSSSDQGGGIFHYAGAAGEALFRSSGGFEAAGTLAGRDAGEFCREFCRAFSYEVPDIRLDGGGSGVFTAAGVFGKLPVFNCTVTFTIQEGVLTAVSGTLLPKSGVPSPEEEPPLSAAGALAAFQRMRRESSAVVSTVTDTQLCYELQTAGSAMSLVPAWRVATDTGDYYVNCLTGAVTAGSPRAGEAA
ncbi:MAG: hypothetical protein HFF97_02960 [Oscillibacter sp.]|uniref:hypothetical protein n=1 Tax=uncultured Oscillibacter sp. TaxID=876091 RepID=UPI00216DF905|nr:hypothetical protein [uncultured Oscillibacter sp.]MCI9643672.1 hypothetical protein [Oscillibacter sp.]